MAIADLPEPLRSAVKSISRKKSCCTGVRDSVELATGWDSGSRSAFYEVDLATGAKMPLAGNSSSHWLGNKTAIPLHTLRPGFVVIDCGVSSGKPAWPNIMFHQADAARLTCHAVEVAA